MLGGLSATALVGALPGCGGDDDGDVADGDGDDGPPGGPVLSQPSRSSPIALSDNGAWIANVNPDNDTLTIFRASDATRLGTVQTGDEPSSVVIAPDNKTAFVANRADATVVRVRDIDTPNPTVNATLTVGSEPTGLALSPTGATLFVAEFAESRVTAVDAATMEGAGNVPVDRPRALLVTNDGDGDDDDETLIVTEFFGEPGLRGEARDDGRTGRVRRFAVSNLEDRGAIALSPIESGFAKGGGLDDAPEDVPVITSPNQLAAMAVHQGRLYVTSVSASPEGPARFDNNVFPVVYVADLASDTEVRDASGTANLARKVVEAIPAPTPEAPRFIPGDLADIAFVPEKNVSYVVGRAADVMLRVVWEAGEVKIGSTQNVEVNLAGNDDIGRCQNPIGVVTNREATRAYVNCWVTRRMAIIDLTSQTMMATLESAPAPAGQLEQSVQRGKRFYFTGRGRWSNAGGNGAVGGEGWSGCGSCHPDGLTDNMTWVFGTGPRQTTSQDGSFSHGPGDQKQRIFNWTAFNDRHHDFERNTRGVSGGLGAITTAAAIGDCNQLDKEQQVALVEGDAPIAELGRPLKELADDPAIALCQHKDWDDIDNFVRTIRPVGRRRALRPDVVERGRALFAQGECDKCHGGQGWTVSRRFFEPSSERNAELALEPFDPPNFFAPTLTYPNGADPRAQISFQPPIAADLTGPAEPESVNVFQLACALRNVGTFGVPGDAGETNFLERRPFQGNLVRAQGRAGYNVPALYGLALGAPYLHHGQAATLDALLTDSRWDFHTNAGNANFSLTMDDQAKRDELIAFLWTIDAKQPEFSTPQGSGGSFDACPVR